jgi:hypothetical protein
MSEPGNSPEENIFSKIEKLNAQWASEMEEVKARMSKMRLQIELYRFERAKLVRAARTKRIQAELRRAERRLRKSQN